MTDAAGEYIYCAIREPSGIFVASLPAFEREAMWAVPSDGAHGIDIDDTGGRLYVACNGGALVALDTETGQPTATWSLPGVPDAAFFNPDSGRVHVAVGEPGVVVSLDLRTGEQTICATEAGAKTTALVRPDSLYVFLPQRGGALELVEQHPLY